MCHTSVAASANPRVTWRMTRVRRLQRAENQLMLWDGDGDDKITLFEFMRGMSMHSQLLGYFQVTEIEVDSDSERLEKEIAKANARVRRVPVTAAVDDCYKGRLRYRSLVP